MRGYSALGLDRIKNTHNLGSIMRAAGNYDVSLVVLSGGRMGRYATDTMDSWRHIPAVHTDDDLLKSTPHGAIPVVIELNDKAKPLPEFTHPERAFYIFGPEDGSVRPEIIARVPHVIYIPTIRCMNLAATVNVVLYDRAVKRGFPSENSTRCLVG